MRAIFHITHFHTAERTQYAVKVVSALRTLTVPFDIVVHTQSADAEQLFNDPAVRVVVHKLADGEHPHYLTWKHREMLAGTSEDYDIVGYGEDDHLFTQSNLDYWLRHRAVCLDAGFYPGFARKETVRDRWNCVDVIHPLHNTLLLGGQNYWINDQNPYCGFWLLDEERFSTYRKDPVFDLRKNPAYGGLTREKAAAGPIPLFKGMLLANEPGAFIHHLPNNYIETSQRGFGSLPVAALLHGQPWHAAV